MLVNYARLQQLEKELLILDKQLDDPNLSETAHSRLFERARRLELEKEEILYPELTFGKRKYEDTEEF